MVDLVVTWVDGNDPVHRRKRNLFAEASRRAGENLSRSNDEMRFADDGELRLCLLSVRKFADWIRKIWIVTDNQVPEFIQRESWPEVTIVDHKDIFEGYEEALPTFNSTTIESVLWRIDGLAEHFISANDDMFFCGKVREDDFFQDSGKVVLRGTLEFVDENKKYKTHHQQNINAARMLGLERVFFPKHVHRALLKSHCKETFARFEESFVQNMQYKFRHRRQFWPIGLFQNSLIQGGRSILVPTADYVLLQGPACREGDELTVEQFLGKLKNNKYKMSCINDLGALAKRYPQVMGELESIVM